MNRTKKSLLMSIVSLLLCLSMLMGTTWAWFTDSVASTGNRIVSGSLKVDLLHYSQNDWVSLKSNPDHKILDYQLWEPGHTRYERIKVKNIGNLALKYQISAEVAPNTAVYGANGERLSDVIDVYVCKGESTPASFADLKADSNWVKTGNLTTFLYGLGFANGSLVPNATTEETLSIAFHMQESAGNEYQNLSVGDIHLTLVATQYTHESDSFGDQYDKDSIFPNNKMSYTYSVPVMITADNKTATDVSIGESDKVHAFVPAGTKLQPGTRELTLTVTDLNTPSTIVVDTDEQSRTFDVHVSGLASDNDVPVIISVKELMPTGLNMGNYTLYHLENDVNVPMTYVAEEALLDAHNEFTYDPATGDVKMALKSFSLVVAVAETDFSWHGGEDYSWFKKDDNGNLLEVLYISNADQFVAFAKIVGGMGVIKHSDGTEEKVLRRTFGINKKDPDDENSITETIQRTIKLTADINLGGAENDRNTDDKGNPYLFYPVGYYNSEGTFEKTGNNEYISSYFKPFSGIFDGQGHTISNIYQNTWELKGDNEYYPASQQCFRDGMGLFGKVWGGTVKNLTVANFTSDGEFTTTGVIAAYADSANGYSATFENIAIKNCNPRVYNIGNGGIVGCVGWYSRSNDNTGKPVIFKNITVDNTNKISALWGSWDVACGGIVGTYYPDSNCGISLDNCHVAAQIDVFNDVCGNYQYYWYRYAGMIIGTIRNNETINNPNYPTLNGYTVPVLTGITATNCTVHFGDWNNYYYCELVANSLASYTHDHQFSRLEQVYSVDVENLKIVKLDGTEADIPMGRRNYVTVDGAHATENATCYHFVDGVKWEHEMAGYENFDLDGNGSLDDWKEDRRHYYLPFNKQLFQGNGWGVKHVLLSENLKEAADYFNTELDITILDTATSDSIVKFDAVKENAIIKFTGYEETDRENLTVKIGDIFTARNDIDAKKPIRNSSVYVTVERLDRELLGDEVIYTSHTGTIDASWIEGTLEFTQTGMYKITIQDYFYCTPTVICISVVPYVDANQAPTYFTGYHGDWYVKNIEDITNASASQTANNAGESSTLLNSVAWRAEHIDGPEIDVFEVLDAEGNVTATYTRNQWIGTYFRATGGIFAAVRELYVTSTVQILENDKPIMFMRAEPSAGSADNNYGKFVLNNFGKKDESLWLSCDVVFDNIEIIVAPANNTTYTNSFKVTNTGRVIINDSVKIDPRLHLIVDNGGYIWLDANSGFASYTGNGTIMVGDNYLAHLQKAAGKAELAELFKFIKGGGMLVDSDGALLKIYHYGDTENAAASEYVIARQDDVIVLDDKTIVAINGGENVPELARYAQYSAQHGKITDKNGNQLVIKTVSNGSYLIVGENGKVPTLDENEILTYTGAIFYAPGGTGNGASAAHPIGDLAEAMSLIEKNGILGFADDQYLANLNTSAKATDLADLYTEFFNKGGKLADKDGNELIINTIKYNTLKYIITNREKAVPTYAAGTLTYNKVLYVTNVSGTGIEGYGLYGFTNATQIIGEFTNGYKIVLNDEGIIHTLNNTIRVDNVQAFIAAGGIVVDGTGNTFSVVETAGGKLLVNSAKGVAYLNGNALAYETNLYVAKNGTGTGLKSSAALGSFATAIEILGEVDGRTITVTDATTINELVADQTTLEALYNFQTAGGKLVIGTSATIKTLAGKYLVETADGFIQEDGSSEWKVTVSDPADDVLYFAYELIGNNDGTIVIDGVLDLGTFVEPAHTGLITITGAGDRCINNIGSGARYYYLNGPTKFENITFNSRTSDGILLVAQYNKIEIGSGVICSGFTGDNIEGNLTVIGGYDKNHSTTDKVTSRTIQTSDVTVRSGDRIYIIGLDYISGTSYGYDSLINIYGGNIYKVYGASRYGSATGNVTVNLHDFSFTADTTDEFIDLNATFAGSSAILNIYDGDFTDFYKISVPKSATGKTVEINADQSKVVGLDTVVKKVNWTINSVNDISGS